MITFIGMLFSVICIFIYFLPSIVAYSRNHTKSIQIFILNIFLGWTFIGWIVALIWAFISD